MNLREYLRGAQNPVEFFKPANSNELQELQERFCQYELKDYLAVLSQTNGLGEVYEDEVRRFVHNHILYPVQKAIAYSDKYYHDEFFVIGGGWSRWYRIRI